LRPAPSMRRHRHRRMWTEWRAREGVRRFGREIGSSVELQGKGRRRCKHRGGGGVLYNVCAPCGAGCATDEMGMSKRWVTGSIAVVMVIGVVARWCGAETAVAPVKREAYDWGKWSK